MDETLIHHLIERHPGAREPWYLHSRWLWRMTPDQLDRLHLELVRQGEDCQAKKQEAAWRYVITRLRSTTLEQKTDIWCDDCMTASRYRFVFATEIKLIPDGVLVFEACARCEEEA